MPMYPLIILMPYIIILFISLKNVKFNDKTLYFGVRLPLNFELTNELKLIEKKYKKETVIYLSVVFLISTILYYTVPEVFSVSVGIVAIFLFSTIGFVCFKLANSRVLAIKKRDKWSGYSKNTVIVDLDYRNDLKKEKISTKLFLIPIFITIISFVFGIYSYNTIKNDLVPGIFGNNGEVLEYVTKGSIVSLLEYISPLFIQVIILAAILFSCFMIIKSKQIINGGEVENLKIYNKKIKTIGIYYTALIATLESLLFTGIFLTFNMESNFIIWFTLLAMIVLVFVYTIHYQKIIKQYKIDYNPKAGEVVSRDDDDNYVWGMFYNNPKDPSISVPKRVGTGFDLNYGNLKVRIVIIILAIALTLELGFTAFVLPFDLENKVPIITKDNIKITGIYGVEINKKDIVSITLEKLPNNLMKTNGAALKKQMLGNFKVDRTYKAKLYVSNSKEKVIKIVKKDGLIIYINHSSNESTEKLYNTLKSF